jgi:hypothetical protein
VICAWGVHGEYREQDLAVLGRLESYGIKPLALGLTKDGHPKHPLYLPRAAELVPFAGRLTQTPK